MSRPLSLPSEHKLAICQEYFAQNVTAAGAQRIEIILFIEVLVLHHNRSLLYAALLSSQCLLTGPFNLNRQDENAETRPPL